MVSLSLRLEGGVGKEEPTTLLSVCLYQINDIVRSSRAVAVCSSFVLLCTALLSMCLLLTANNTGLEMDVKLSHHWTA